MCESVYVARVMYLQLRKGMPFFTVAQCMGKCAYVSVCVTWYHVGICVADVKYVMCLEGKGKFKQNTNIAGERVMQRIVVCCGVL